MSAKQLQTPLPSNHPLFSATTGHPTEALWRRWTRKQLGQLKTCRIRSIVVGGRPAIFYSAEDLTVGLVGQPIDGITGYEPKTASELMTDIILFSTGNGWKPPTTQPATAPATVPVK